MIRNLHILQEDATEHVGEVLRRVKHEYLVSVHLSFTRQSKLIVGYIWALGLGFKVGKV